MISVQNSHLGQRGLCISEPGTRGPGTSRAGQETPGQQVPPTPGWVSLGVPCGSSAWTRRSAAPRSLRRACVLVPAPAARSGSHTAQPAHACACTQTHTHPPRTLHTRVTLPSALRHLWRWSSRGGSGSLGWGQAELLPRSPVCCGWVLGPQSPSYGVEAEAVPDGTSSRWLWVHTRSRGCHGQGSGHAQPTGSRGGTLSARIAGAPWTLVARSLVVRRISLEAEQH